MAKRKEYDSSKHRKIGTDMEGFGKAKGKLGKSFNNGKVSKEAMKPPQPNGTDSTPKWKEDSNRLRQAMKCKC